MNTDILTQIAELENKITELPMGSVGQKQVNGKVYYYHRFREDGRRREKYIPESEVAALREQIEQRKALEKELKELKKRAPQKEIAVKQHDFMTDVRIGDALRAYSNVVREYKKRSHYQRLHDYVYGNTYDRVFILFGLRRTGKTTLIRQIFADMTDADLAKAAFIQITSKDTLADLNKDLKYLQSEGYQYVFIDEGTLMSDFIEGAALLSDIYAAMGMKIVLSGTDLLGFLFSEDDQLYIATIKFIRRTFLTVNLKKSLASKGLRNISVMAEP